MIFNPLFIGDNGITQSLIPKSGKLANNKYLFSDIVKVVMNPSKKGNGKPSLNLNGINSELKLGLENEQKFVQLKYRLLTDEHSEQVKSELADILPADIAQLLVNEELISDDNKAVSYISKETLKGELQNFLHNLIGAEIIEQNITQKSGLLLNLEDHKSAVNIELVEDSKTKSASDKIIVQTLVVPEKSRLLSIFGNGGNKEAMFRTSGEGADKIFSNGQGINLTNVNPEIISPTLSVYSFSHEGNEFESLTKNIKSNSTFKHNLDLLKSSNDKVQHASNKVPLEKISFLPRELKNEAAKIEGLKTKISASKINTELKLVNPNEVKKESEYSVSKITIVKKQDENNVLNMVKSKTKLTPIEFESALRRIDFNNEGEEKKSDLHLIKKTQSNVPKTDNAESAKLAGVEKSQADSKSNSELKTELKNNVTTQEKTINEELVKEKVTSDAGGKQVQKENQEIKIASQNAVNPNIENGETTDNKKVSVKVKGGVKSVSNTNESIKNATEEKPTTSNTANNDNSNSENDESKNSQSSSSKTNVFEMKQHTENNFQQTLIKNELGPVNPTDPKLTLAEQNVLPHIVKSVEVIKELSKFIAKQENGSLSFDIRPEHLGKMKITLDTVDKILKVNIEVENEHAKQLVEKNIDKLQQQLSNNGLQLNSLNISLSYSKQQRDGKKINNKTQNESENLGQVGETEEENNKKQLGYNTYEYIA